ncbi:MAG: hypothetical protein IT328_22525 [Caldilineaceae bacterium]|nr:hypothetical protein [Caldilineaceae bacterium]
MNAEKAMIDDNVSATSGNQPAALTAKGDFTLPLGTTTRGRLLFASGAANVHVGVHPDRAALYAAHFERQIPTVWVQDGIVTIQYRRYSPLDWLVSLAEPLAMVKLNATIPWEIEFRGDVSRFSADLRRLHVRALDLHSVSTALIRLAAPLETANIYLSSNASDLTVHRPAGVAIRLQISGSASHLTLDGQRFGAVGGGIHWQTPDYHDSTSRYDIGIAGSVSNMTIGTR